MRTLPIMIGLLLSPFAGIDAAGGMSGGGGAAGGVSGGTVEQTEAALREKVERILTEVPLIDGHNDVPWQYRRRVDLRLDAIDFNDTTTLDPPMHTDIPRLREGMVGGQFWSVYIPIGMRGGRPGDGRTVIEQIDFTHRLIDRYSDHLELALTADDVERIHSEGRIASLLGMEGGHSIENSMGVLRSTYALGARYMTLTHNRATDWADAATDSPINDGLTPFGEEIVREMNRLGMLIDLSHVSPKTMHDTLDVTRAPVIFSHSSAYSICQHVRNVPDDVLKRLPDNNGVIMICFLGFFVSEELRQWSVVRNEERQRLVQLHREDAAAIERDMEQWFSENPMPEATLSQVADHIDYVRDLIGVEYIGIGADYDGTTSLPVDMPDVTSYPDLFVELLRRGYSEEDVKKIAGLNVLRALREAEQVAAELQKTEQPSEATIEELDVPRR